MKAVKDYINLLPLDEKKPSPVSGRALALIILFALLWLGLFGWQARQYLSLRTRLDAVSAQKQALQLRADAISKELSAPLPGGMTRNKAVLIQDILSERVLWSRVFKQLSLIVPRGLWFDYLEGNADGRAEIKIKGGAFNYVSIADFMSSMEKSRYFEHPSLSYAQKIVVQGRDVVGFELICGIQKEQGAR
jgi:Tfp pilus assembly protein PilN